MWVIAASILAADQLSKQWMMRVPGQITVIPGLLSFVIAHNTGAAFGMLAGFKVVFMLAAAGLIGAAVIYGHIIAEYGRPGLVAAGLLLGGAAGNLIDRFAYGHVIDFLSVSFFPFIFNVADAAVTIGCALAAWRILTMEDPT
jgi:signal peptidase II